MPFVAGAVPADSGEPIDMARFRFQEGQEVAGRLERVLLRPLENGPKAGVSLLRLEFSIYSIQSKSAELVPTGALACRDIVVGPSIDATRDSSLMAYANALGVGDEPQNQKRWLALEGKNRWLGITFGAPRPPDFRNPFTRIAPLDVTNFTIARPTRSKTPDWARVKQVAEALDVSESTARRMADELEKEWGEDVVRRSPGGQRQIYLPLLLIIRKED